MLQYYLADNKRLIKPPINSIIKVLFTGGFVMPKKESCKVEKAKDNKDMIYFYVGDETIVINPCADEINHMDTSSPVHFMLTDMKDEHVSGLATMIKRMTLNDMISPHDIKVYYPNGNLVNMLDRKGVSNDKYTFYINLWDDMNVGGYRKGMEYIFEKNQGTYESYSLEFSMENEFCVYFSGNSPIVKQRVIDTRIYDRIYQWCGNVATKDYPGYDEVVKAFSGKYKRKTVWLVVNEAGFDNQKAESDGFMLVDNI